MSYAQDHSDYENTVWNALKEKIKTHSLDEITESSFSCDEKEEIGGVFCECMSEGDICEIHSRIATFSYDEFKYYLNDWADQCFKLVLERQIDELRGERDEQAADDIGAGRI